MNRKKPAPAIVVQQRVEEVLGIRLAGAEFWDVREYARGMEKRPGSAWLLAADEPPLSDGQLWRYIARADKLAMESTRSTRKTRVRNHIAKRRYLYAKSVASGDYGKALAILDSEAKLLGLFPSVDAEAKRIIDQLTERISGLERLQSEAGRSNGQNGQAGNGRANGHAPGTLTG